MGTGALFCSEISAAYTYDAKISQPFKVFIQYKCQGVLLLLDAYDVEVTASAVVERLEHTGRAALSSG